MTRELVIFDLDGTLVKLMHDQDKLNSLRMLVTEEIEKSSFVDKGMIRGGVFGLYRLLETHSMEDKSIRVKIRNYIDRYELGCAAEAELREEIYSAIPDLKKCGAIIGMITNNGRACVDKLFTLGIIQEREFDMIITRDEMDKIKPDSWSLTQMIDLAKGRPDNIFFVGDSMNDSEMANAYNAIKNGNVKWIDARDISTAEMLKWRITNG